MIVLAQEVPVGGQPVDVVIGPGDQLDGVVLVGKGTVDLEAAVDNLVAGKEGQALGVEGHRLVERYQGLHLFDRPHPLDLALRVTGLQGGQKGGLEVG